MSVRRLSQQKLSARNYDTTIQNSAARGSVQFNGSNQYLSIANAANFNLGTSDYTIEFWMKPTSTAASSPFCKSYDSNTYEFLYNWYALSSMSFLYTDDGVTSTSGSVSATAWTHVAASRASGTTRLFINGAVDGTFTTVRTLDGTNPTLIGWGGSTLNGYFGGYVSNVRIVKGSALYQSAFTVPTSPLTAISGTTFLACQGTLVDNGPDALSITAVGSPTASTLSPFP